MRKVKQIISCYGIQFGNIVFTKLLTDIALYQYVAFMTDASKYFIPQMKQEYKEIIMKAMPLLVSDLVVDTSFMAYFEQHGILDEDTRNEIMVR